MRKKCLIPVVLAVIMAVSACARGGASTSFDSELSLVGEAPKKQETGASVSETASASEQTSVVETPETEEEEYYYGEYKELKEGDRAPWFKATLVDGSSFDIKDNLGKVILVNFWATWCGPCVGEMPAFESLYSDYGPDSDVVIVAVDCAEGSRIVDKFVSENGYTFPVAYDPDGEICDQYPTGGIPYTVIIGKDGNIRNIHLGARDADYQYQIYKGDIEAALAE